MQEKIEIVGDRKYSFSLIMFGKKGEDEIVQV